jgi:hypothetical protein
MRSARYGRLAVAALFIWVCAPASAFARTFGGFECTDDCTGHAAGYKWAEEHNIDDEETCPAGNSWSFHEGCIVYVREPTRGADDDDDGDAID